MLGGTIVLAQDLGRFRPQPQLVTAMAGLALAHALWFSGLLYNPLWDRQAVGPTPVLNMVLAAGAVAPAATLFLRRQLPETVRPVVDAAVMLISGVTALALLRQAFAGSNLTGAPMSGTEDLLRSLLGIVLALAFLFAGKWRAEPSRRIGSLVIMLLAVAKVFIWDAAGLE